MKKKIETDNITKDVMAAEAAGYGPHYGHYIADHGHSWKEEEETTQKSEKEQVCQLCGDVFMRPDNLKRKYCSPECRCEAMRRSRNAAKNRLKEQG